MSFFGNRNTGLYFGDKIMVFYARFMNDGIKFNPQAFRAYSSTVFRSIKTLIAYGSRAKMSS
jgi:hypothetical protein